MVLFDLMRYKTRLFNSSKKICTNKPLLHLGCGNRKIKGWINADITASDINIDLGSGTLPWVDNSFNCIVSQHVIDDLDINDELIPLLKECNRIISSGGEIWISCPDIEKICISYLNNNFSDLIEDRKKRFPNYTLGDMPNSQFFNDLIFEGGNNVNFFDYSLLKYILEEKAGFINCEKISERDLLLKFNNFPKRQDKKQTLYIRAFVE